ncbi:MAG: helix-turn-helix domain-containing protein [Burkholderiaceae bacterium]
MDKHALPLPCKRGLSKEQAADYLGIGVTLLSELDIPFIKLGRRCIYDRVDLDLWLHDTKKRGRAGKETLWLNRVVSTEGPIQGTGGLVQPFQTAGAYAKTLGLKSSKTRKRS